MVFRAKMSAWYLYPGERFFVGRSPFVVVSPITRSFNFVGYSPEVFEEVESFEVALVLYLGKREGIAGLLGGGGRIQSLILTT